MLIVSELLTETQTEFLNFIHKSELLEAKIDNIDRGEFPNKISK